MVAVERTPLTRERIALSALEIGDADGLDAVSMRKVGSSLGVEAMSLYNHVANKGDLLDAIGDLLYGEILDRHQPDPSAVWSEQARHLVQTFYDVAMEHPHMSSIILDRPIPSLTKVFFLQQCFDLLVSAGYPTKEAALSFHTVASWMTGFVRNELTFMKQLQEQGVGFSREDVPEEFHGALDFMECCTASTVEERFNAGFETLLFGLERELSDRGWA